MEGVDSERSRRRRDARHRGRRNGQEDVHAARPYHQLQQELAAFLPTERLIVDPLRLLAWGTDASFYRLVPKLLVVVDDEAELRRVLAGCARLGTPVTFRAAGTSLSGQAISDSVLVMLGDGWRGIEVAADGASITLQPGVIGAAANRRLAPLGRKIGPDPASIDAAMIGGIAANNASGMCCGTAQNSYNTLAGLRIVFADGTVLDTRDAASRAEFARLRPELVEGLGELARATREDATLAARIRHKFRLKNTTGYSLNALVDFTDPVDILAHLMIGSEGTLGFISEITYQTVEEHAHKASALILFDRLETACSAVTRLKQTPVVAVELLDRASLHSVEHKPGMPEGLRALPEDGAALLVETRAATAAALAVKIDAIATELESFALFTPLRFATDPAEAKALWNVRKGMFPAVGAMRPLGTTVIIEDVAFPIERLAEATLDLQKLLHEHGYHEAIIFGHALEGNLHFVFTQDFGNAAEIERYHRFMDEMCAMVVEKYDGSLKAEHGTGRNVAPYVELEWGAQAVAAMRRIKALFDPTGPAQSRGDPERRPARAPEGPEAAAGRRSARRQVHRVRLLRAEVPVARADAVAAPAHRRLARDREARGRRPRARAPGRDEGALRLPRHRDLRRLRTLRDGVPGRHRGRPAHQGLARTSRGPACQARRRGRGESLRGRHRGRSFRTRRRRPAARHRRHVDDEGQPRRPAQGVGRTIAQVVAGARTPGALRAVAAPAERRRAPGLLPELRGAQHGSAARPRWRGAAQRRRAPVPARRLRRRLSGRARRPVLRPAVREQGARRGRRPEVVASSPSRCARRARTAAGRSSSTPAPAPTG